MPREGRQARARGGRAATNKLRSPTAAHEVGRTFSIFFLFHLALSDVHLPFPSLENALSLPLILSFAWEMKGAPLFSRIKRPPHTPVVLHRSPEACHVGVQIQQFATSEACLAIFDAGWIEQRRLERASRRKIQAGLQRGRLVARGMHLRIHGRVAVA